MTLAEAEEYEEDMAGGDGELAELIAEAESTDDYQEREGARRYPGCRHPAGDDGVKPVTREPLDTGAVRAAFDAQVRRKAEAGEPGAVIEPDNGVLRWVAPGTQTSCIIWSALTGDNADSVIAAQRAYFAGRGTPVEWKYYDYDQPADLPARLVAAGFEPDDEETMMVAEAAAIDPAVVLPPGVRLVPVTDEAGVAATMAVHDLAFAEHPSPELGKRLLTQFRDAPGLLHMVVAMAGDEPVSAARIEFIPGTDFAGLWGGGTVPAWRGRGIFRALVAYRAGLAAERGYRYLQVDALPTSRPILQRLGFREVARTTPYVFTPAGARARCSGADTMYPW